MFVLPYLLAGAFGVGLIKVGMLSVWVLVLGLALKLTISIIVLLAGLLGWQHTKK
jgi:hypothetical protein